MVIARQPFVENGYLSLRFPNMVKVNISPKQGRTEMILYTVIITLIVPLKYWSNQCNIKVTTMNNIRKEDWLHMYVSGCNIYFNSVHISLLPKFFLWDTNRKKACHKCLNNSSRGSITAVKLMLLILSIVPSCVLWNLTLTRFLSNNYTSQQMNRNEFLKTIRLTSFQKPTITTKNKIA